MDLKQLESALGAYIDNKVLPAIKGDGNKLKQGLTIGLILQAKASGFIDNYFKMMANDPMFVALGVMTQDGKLGDVDTICASLKGAIEQVGDIQVPILDIKFSPADVDEFKEYLHAAEGIAG